MSLYVTRNFTKNEKEFNKISDNLKRKFLSSQNSFKFTIDEKMPSLHNQLFIRKRLITSCSQ